MQAASLKIVFGFNRNWVKHFIFNPYHQKQTLH